MSIAMAGVLCGTDPEKVKQLPRTDGWANEVIIQKGHKIGYSQALTNVGAKVVEVVTVQDVEKAISKKTAMMWFLNANVENGEIKWEEFVALGKKHNIPTFIDCAADRFPISSDLPKWALIWWPFLVVKVYVAPKVLACCLENANILRLLACTHPLEEKPLDVE
jgi:seryl-tRNA(Sec) selenium transferase